MNYENYAISYHQILVVSCSCDLTDEERQAAQAYTLADTLEDADQRMAHNRYLCVIACVDPSRKESIDQLQKLQEASRKSKIPLATISQFNPIWIENLMTQLGVAMHFKSFPDLAQIASIVATSVDAVSVGTEEAGK